MNACSIDIVELLESESGLGLVFAKTLFVSIEPTSPPDCVTIFDTTSIPPQLNLTSQGYEYPSVQIRVRNKDFQTGWNLIETIKTLLHGLGNVTIGDYLYSVIYCASGPALLDFDENSRARIICNFNLQRRASV